MQASFPLEPDNKLLAERFDAVVCLATIMHIPDRELFTYAFQVKSLLNSKAIFICSFCPGREIPDEDPRLFVNREPSQIQLFFERIGFRLLYASQSKDGLGRDIQWTIMVFESEILLPQMNGFEKNRKIAFRTQLSRLVAFFHGKGGLSAFHAAWRAGRLDPQA